jgi:exopolyphosphatase/guanosine-5'-triphosphate,3'-diphosphate pyrophosphatase
LFEKAIGYPIEIISGEEEGRLIYMGVASTLNLPLERRLVIDIGGGSTELILGEGPEIEQVESFSIGTVPTSTRFFDSERITANAFDESVLYARSVFEDGVAAFHPRYWEVGYGSSGTLRTLADVIEKNALGDGQLSVKNLLILRDLILEAGRISKLDLIGVRPERASVVLGGLSVLIGLSQTRFGETFHETLWCRRDTRLPRCIECARAVRSGGTRWRTRAHDRLGG